MITGNNERPIKSFSYIDHIGEGLGTVTPKEGEEFIGIPYAWHSDNSYPFIEVRKEGKVTRTINTLDVSEIVFEEDA